MASKIQGGAATKAVQTSGRRLMGGAAIPIAILTDDDPRLTVAGAALPIEILEAGDRPLMGGAALPVRLFSSADQPIVAGPALPVIVVIGSVGDGDIIIDLKSTGKLRDDRFETDTLGEYTLGGGNNPTYDAVNKWAILEGATAVTSWMEWVAARETKVFELLFYLVVAGSAFNHRVQAFSYYNAGADNYVETISEPDIQELRRTGVLKANDTQVVLKGAWYLIRISTDNGLVKCYWRRWGSPVATWSPLFNWTDPSPLAGAGNVRAQGYDGRAWLDRFMVTSGPDVTIEDVPSGYTIELWSPLDYDKDGSSPITGPTGHGDFARNEDGSLYQHTDGNYYFYEGTLGATPKIWLWRTPDLRNFTVYGVSPVLDVGIGGSWEDLWVGFPCVIVKTSNDWYMFYEGNSGTNSQIGRATSSDGITWNKDGGNPILTVGAGGLWDDVDAGTPFIVKVGAQYYLYYHGNDGSANLEIGYATMASLGAAPSKHGGNPVFSYGEPAEWDSSWVGDKSIISVGTGYLMIYEGNDAAGPIGGEIGAAWSDDCSKWRRLGRVLTSTAGTWDRSWVQNPKVFWEVDNPIGGDYLLLYNGGWQAVSEGIGYAYNKSIGSGVADGGTIDIEVLAYYWPMEGFYFVAYNDVLALLGKSARYNDMWGGDIYGYGSP